MVEMLLCVSIVRINCEVSGALLFKEKKMYLGGQWRVNKIRLFGFKTAKYILQRKCFWFSSFSPKCGNTKEKIEDVKKINVSTLGEVTPLASCENILRNSSLSLILENSNECKILT